MHSDSKKRISSFLDALLSATGLVIVALFLFVSVKVGTRGVGLYMVAGALIQQWEGRIAHGWEDQPPSGYITGWVATVFNLILGMLGLAVAIWPEVAMGIIGWNRE